MKIINYETKVNGYVFEEELTLIETICGINIQVKDTCGSSQICIPKPVDEDLERVKKDVVEWLHSR
ncbi:hypothetical protein [Candidatus Methanomassiliicoccus intestinalis]|jgi:hypothetical protein|uniref:Uncharacterized protein n=1 Tax=Siphoviridae sp. ctedO8 TaxID=2827907 RepID=A0A8S5T2Y5_9CAUD|nr:MAG TPA: hypothetical protein [Siphoviridae sp. ctedO8]